MEPPPFLATIFDVIGSNPLLPAGTALVVALLAVIAIVRLRSRIDEDQEQTRQRLDTLWREMDELRVDQFGGSKGALPDTEHHTLDPEHLAIEKAAYDQLWPLICSLHDKLGTFLRAVETGEPATESRLSARNAALDARTTLNNVRPFCHERIDDLATQLIDMEIKAHLAGCQYQDLRKETGNPEESEQEHLHQKFRILYDGDSRELMNQLIEAIRRRMIKRSS